MYVKMTSVVMFFPRVYRLQMTSVVMFFPRVYRRQMTSLVMFFPRVYRRQMTPVVMFFPRVYTRENDAGGEGGVGGGGPKFLCPRYPIASLISEVHVPVD